MNNYVRSDVLVDVAIHLVICCVVISFCLLGQHAV
jgi:hypothetical protein